MRIKKGLSIKEGNAKKEAYYENENCKTGGRCEPACRLAYRYNRKLGNRSQIFKEGKKRDRAVKFSEVKMKRLERFIFLIASCVILVFLTHSAKASITDVDIFPEAPTAIDLITISVSGVEGSGDVLITDSDFNIQGTVLELDIFLEVGAFPVITPWSHSEDVGPLPAGMYDLTVRTLELAEVTDTYSMPFEVVPEPATVLLLAVGALLAKRCC